MDFRLTPQRLDSFFQFQSISQKYDRFCSFVDPDTFFFPERKRRDECLPHIYAGGDITYTVSSSFIMKELPLYLMMYVWKGEAAASCPGYKGALLPESLLLLPPECEWKLELSSVPFSCTLYFIGGTAVQSYLGRLQEQDANGRAAENTAVVRSVQDPYASGVFRHINRYLPYADADACFTIAHLLTELLTKCIMEGSTPPIAALTFPKHVQHMKSVFENDYPNPHTLEELELELGISKYRLCRDFSKYMQKSPIQYLNQIRLEAAMELLTTTDLAVHMISSAVGIPNTSYFIHLFSREYGITPLQYRQAHSQQL